MSFIASITDENVDLSSFIPVIKVIGVGGAGGNAIANIMLMGLEGVQCAIANTDAQSLVLSPCKIRIQLGRTLTAGLGAGAVPEVGKKAALENKDEIVAFLTGTNMVFITAGMGGGTGTGAAPVIAQIAREMGIVTVAVVTKPFNFEGHHRIEVAEHGVQELAKHVDTIIVVANQKLFRVSNENTTFTEAFRMADDVLYGGVKCITDLITMPGLINLDFADIRTVMSNMGYAMMGSSEASGEGRANTAIEMAITNPLLENVSLEGAKWILVNITGGPDMTLFEVNDIVAKIQERIDADTRLIFGAIFDQNMEGKISVAVVATGVQSADKKESQSAKIVSQQRQQEEVVQQQPVEKITVAINKPPYMQQNTQQQQKIEPIVLQVEEVYKKEESFEYYPKDDQGEDSYNKNRSENRFDNDIESDIISAVGANDFLAPAAIIINKQSEVNIAKNREFNQVRYSNNVNEFDAVNIPKSYVQPSVTVEQDVHLAKKEDYQVGEEAEDIDSYKKPSIFSRMAGIIKDKRKDYEDSDQKKKLSDIFATEQKVTNNKIKAQPSDLFSKDAYIDKRILKDNNDSLKKSILSSGFFSVIEDDNLKND